MAETIKKLTIEGFKSIRKLEDFELRGLNVLIGANGAGKSNFVSFFRFLSDLIQQRLQRALAVDGGGDAFLYLGLKETQRIKAKLHFGLGRDAYEFSLVPTHDGRLIFEEESTTSIWTFGSSEERTSLGSGHPEANLKDRRDQGYFFVTIRDWVAYHFHDTSFSAGVRRPQAINDNFVLRSNADNLAPLLYTIRRTSPACYTHIRDVVRLAAPFFDDFLLRPIPGNEEMLQLEWRQKGSDYPFRANQLSDGTLRLICLATALLQPFPPITTLFDEPELGLHPYALTLVGNLMRQAVKMSGTSVYRQIIVATQSVSLLNEFAPEDVIVVDRHQGESTFRRLSSDGLSEWLGEYGLGELWQKNVLGGRPSDERTPELVPKGGNGVL